MGVSLACQEGLVLLLGTMGLGFLGASSRKGPLWLLQEHGNFTVYVYMFFFFSRYPRVLLGSF